MLPVGTRVKESFYAWKNDEQYMHNCGTQPRKGQLKDALEKRKARRGVVEAHLKGDIRKGSMDGLGILWDDGTTSRCLGYMVELATD